MLFADGYLGHSLWNFHLLKSSLDINHHSFKQWTCAVRHQGNTRAIDGPDLCRHMVSICQCMVKYSADLAADCLKKLSVLLLLWPVYNGTTVETLYSTIYYSKYFIELNFDKSAQYVALWTHKRHPIPRPFGRAMECLLWVLQQKLTVL